MLRQNFLDIEFLKGKIKEFKLNINKLIFDPNDIDLNNETYNIKYEIFNNSTTKFHNNKYTCGLSFLNTIYLHPLFYLCNDNICNTKNTSLYLSNCNINLTIDNLYDNIVIFDIINYYNSSLNKYKNAIDNYYKLAVKFNKELELLNNKNKKELYTNIIKANIDKDSNIKNQNNLEIINDLTNKKNNISQNNNILKSYSSNTLYNIELLDNKDLISDESTILELLYNSKLESFTFYFKLLERNRDYINLIDNVEAIINIPGSNLTKMPKIVSNSKNNTPIKTNYNSCKSNDANNIIDINKLFNYLKHLLNEEINYIHVTILNSQQYLSEIYCSYLLETIHFKTLNKLKDNQNNIYSIDDLINILKAMLLEYIKLSRGNYKLECFTSYVKIYWKEYFKMFEKIILDKFSLKEEQFNDELKKYEKVINNLNNDCNILQEELESKKKQVKNQEEESQLQIIEIEYLDKQIKELSNEIVSLNEKIN